MPLSERRPMLRPITIQASMSSEGSLRTPLPTTPLGFNQPLPLAPMVMTPDTPGFDLNALESFSLKRERSCDSNIVEELDLDWSEDEDGLLQSVLLQARTKYPPGELPPSSALDQMTTQILTSRGRPSTNEEMGEVETLLDEAPSAWRHGWAATRRRLFDIARFESREAVGGHRRGSAEAIVGVEHHKATTRKFVRPKLVVLGGQGMNRQQHSMDSLFGDAEPPSISEAMRLSGNLQDRTLSTSSDSTKELHSTIALESPLHFEFGQVQKLPALPPARKAVPTFPFPGASRATIPRPSLLQRGHSYTGEDLMRESGHSRNSSRSSITSSDDFAIEVEEATILPVTKRAMQRSASSPTSAIGPKPITLGAGAAWKMPIVETMEPDPITPLNQTTFPHAAIGLGPWMPSVEGPGGPEDMSLESDDDSSEATPKVESPVITFKITSPAHSPRPGSSTPTAGLRGAECFDAPAADFARMALHDRERSERSERERERSGEHRRERSGEREPMIMPKFTSLNALSAIANGLVPSPPPGHAAPRRRPAPFDRSISEGTSFGLSKSVSHPALSSPPTRSASSPGGPISPGAPAPREVKRQRQLPSSSSSSSSSGSSTTTTTAPTERTSWGRSAGASARQRLNPGLSVAVPPNGLLARAALGALPLPGTVEGGLDGGLRSPFEPKTFKI